MRLFIRTMPASITEEVILIDDQFKDRPAYITFENSDLVAHTFDRGSADVKPLFSGPADMVYDIVKAFIKYAEETGRIDSSGKPAMDATKYHLEDLRHLLKLDEITVEGVPHESKL